MSGSMRHLPDSEQEQNANTGESSNEEDEGDRKPSALSPSAAVVAATAAASSNQPTKDSEDDRDDQPKRKQSPSPRRRSSPVSSRKRQRQEASTAASASEADDEETGADSDGSVEMAHIACDGAAAHDDDDDEGGGDGDEDVSEDESTAGDEQDPQQVAAATEASAIRQQAHAVSVISMQEKWDEMFARLVQFKSKHGHCLVPNRYKEDTSLGSWVATQRRTYKNLTSGGTASSGMNLDRARRLIEIGFEWSTTDPRHRPWEERYEELQAFVAVNGHAEVPMRWEENVQLSNWVSKQRQDYKLLQRGKTTRLTDKRRKLLNDVGFVWEIPRKGRRLRVAAKKIQRGASSNGGVVVSSSEGGGNTTTTTNTSLNSTNTVNPQGLASIFQAAVVSNQALGGPQQIFQTGSVLPPGLSSLPASLQTALSGAATAPGAIPSSVSIAASAAGLAGAAPGPDAVQSILGASTQNAHVANVVALAQLILSAQQQQPGAAGQYPGAVSLLAQQQQQAQAQQLTNNLLLQAAAGSAQPQGNAFMNMLQGAMQGAAAQQQAAAAQPQQVSATDLQSIATAIITTQLGGGAATGTPAAAAASQATMLGIPAPSVASDTTSVGLQQQTHFGQSAQHVPQQHHQPGAAGNQPTFLVLPLQMNEQQQQQLQAQQGLLTQPAAVPIALDMNALASLGISPQQLGSFGLAPSATTQHPLMSTALLQQQPQQQLAPTQQQLQMFQQYMQQQQQQQPGPGGPQHLALPAQARTAPQQPSQQETDASTSTPTRGGKRKDPS